MKRMQLQHGLRQRGEKKVNIAQATLFHKSYFCNWLKFYLFIKVRSLMGNPFVTIAKYHVPWKRKSLNSFEQQPPPWSFTNALPAISVNHRALHACACVCVGGGGFTVISLEIQWRAKTHCQEALWGLERAADLRVRTWLLHQGSGFELPSLFLLPPNILKPTRTVLPKLKWIQSVPCLQHWPRDLLSPGLLLLTTYLW